MLKLKAILCLLGLNLLLCQGFLAKAEQVLGSAEVPESSFADSIFRSSVNSPGYLVVKKTDWERLKKIWSDSFTLQNKILESERKAFQSKLDSLQQKSPQLVGKQNHEESKVGYPSNFSTSLFLILASSVLLFYSILLTFSHFRLKKGTKLQNDRVEHFENELNFYKKSSIDRERKLMRELIDTRNQLEGEKNKQNLNSLEDLDT
jgi:hypothetical protein